MANRGHLLVNVRHVQSVPVPSLPLKRDVGNLPASLHPWRGVVQPVAQALLHARGAGLLPDLFSTPLTASAGL